MDKVSSSTEDECAALKRTALPGERALAFQDFSKELSEQQQRQHAELLHTMSCQYEELSMSVSRLVQLVERRQWAGAAEDFEMTSDPNTASDYVYNKCHGGSTCSVLRKQQEEEIHACERLVAQTREHETKRLVEEVLGSSEGGRRAFCQHIAKTIVNYEISMCGHKQKVFDCVSVLFILASAICVGMEADLSLHNMNYPDEDQYNVTIFERLDLIFLFVYYIEIIARYTANGYSRMIVFDTFLVVVGTVSAISIFVNDVSSNFQESLKTVLVLRICRLIRLARSLRTFRHFAVLWRLVAGMLRSVSAMFSTIVLLAFTFYMAACFAIELVSKDPLLRTISETRSIIETYFWSLNSILITLVQFVTMDDLSGMYLPLIKQRKYLVIYFAVVIMVVSVSLMNLVTALLVENVIMATEKDRKMDEHRARQMRPILKKAFRDMDQNGDKVLSKYEVASCHSQLPKDVLEIVPEGKLIDLFDVLDLNESGTITEDEFVEGLEQLVLSHVSIKGLQQLRLLTQIKNQQGKSLVELNIIDRKLKCLLRCVPEACDNILKCLSQPSDWYSDLEEVQI